MLQLVYSCSYWCIYFLNSNFVCSGSKVTASTPSTVVAHLPHYPKVCVRKRKWRKNLFKDFKIFKKKKKKLKV